MKKILFLVLGATLLSLSSCFEIDNWDAPNCTWSGTVTDSYTGQPLASSQNDWQMRIWERSWTGHEEGATANQDLRIKQDGTYENTKLFAGTYDFLPYNGPFWPVDTVKGLELKKKLQFDYEVTPYLQIMDHSVELYQNKGIDSVRVKFKVRAPLLKNLNPTTGDSIDLPRLYEARVYFSFLEHYCGGGSNSSLGTPQYVDNVRVRPANNTANQWAALLDANNTTPEYSFGAPVRKGYTYYIRSGAAVDDPYRKPSYSDIVKIHVPN